MDVVPQVEQAQLGGVEEAPEGLGARDLDLIGDAEGVDLEDVEVVAFAQHSPQLADDGGVGVGGLKLGEAVAGVRVQLGHGGALYNAPKSSFIKVWPSTHSPSAWAPQWRCGPVTRPVFPTRPMTWPCFTTSPSFTRNLDMWK